ncbi:MAG: hypothetical protein PWP23_373 [Candidatus Sumerlaeota bacterium]|nr:hypothetical protein [Candidatus Sumerlaeota bacterium]
MKQSTVRESWVLFLLACIPLLLTPLAAEESTYTMMKDIPYREEADGDLTEAMRERCRLDLYCPAGRQGFATVVWFHGGGLRSGEKEVPGQLRGQEFAVAAVNYRLFPASKTADAIDDAAAATAWVMREIESHGGDPGRVFVAGYSAGGYLAALIALDESHLRNRGAEANRLAGVISLSGHMITHFTVREERGIPGTQAVVDELAPLYHVRADAPPLVLITGDREKELLGRYEENAYMARMMKEVGHEGTKLIEIKGPDHGGMLEPAYPLLVEELARLNGEKTGE